VEKETEWVRWGTTWCGYRGSRKISWPMLFEGEKNGLGVLGGGLGGTGGGLWGEKEVTID